MSGFAQTLYWDTNGATAGFGWVSGNNASISGAWNSAFWTTDSTGASATQSYVSGADVVFGSPGTLAATTSGTVTFSSNVFMNSLTLDTGVAGGNIVFIGNNSGITIGDGGLTYKSAKSGGLNIFAANVGPITLGQSGVNQTWTNSTAATAGHSYNVLAAVQGSASAGNTQVWTILTQGAMASVDAFNGVISDGANGGRLSVVLDQSGGSNAIRTMNGLNTYTGQFVLKVGQVNINTLANAGQASSLGAATGANAVISLGSGANPIILNYTGVAAVTDRIIDLAGTTGAVTLNNNGSAGTTLTFNGNITASGAGAKTLTLGGSANGVINGTIVDSAGGVTSLTKSGAGAWTLNGANSFSGLVTVSSGTLVAGNVTALGSGTIQLNGGNVTINVTGVTNTINLNGGFLNLNQSVAGTINFWSGGVSLGTGVALPTFIDQSGGANGGVLAVSGVGDFGLTGTAANLAAKLPNDKWYLGANGSATLTVTTLGGNSVGDYHLGGGGGILTIQNGVLTGAGSVNIGSTGGGNVVLASTGNTYTGDTVVQTGSLTVTSVGNQASVASSLGNGSGMLILDASGTSVGFIYNGSGESTDRSIVVKGGANSVTFANSGNGSVTFNDIIATTPFNLVLGGTADTYGGVLVGVNSSISSVTKNGLANSLWKLDDTNAYSGATTINGGVLQVASVSVLANSSVSVKGTVGANTDFSKVGILQTNGVLNRTLGGTGGNGLSWSSGGGFAAKGGKLTISLVTSASDSTLIVPDWGITAGFAGTGNTNIAFGSTTADSQVEFTNNFGLGSGSNQRTIFVDKGIGGDSALLSGNINSASSTNGTASGIFKGGAGTLILSGSNTFGGSTANGGLTVGKGVVLINNKLGSGSGNGFVTVNASPVGAVAILGGTGRIALGAGMALKVTGTGGANTVGGVMSVNPGIANGGLDNNTGILAVDLSAAGSSAQFAAGSTFLFTLDATAGVSDLLSFMGLTSGSQISFANNTINFNQVGSFLTSGQYTLMSFAGSGFDFSTLSGLQIGSGLSGYSSANLIYTSNSVILNIVAIPEPSTVVLFTIGLVLLGYSSWRKSRKTV